MNNTFFNICKDFAEGIEKVDDILDLQVIVPIKDRQSGVWKLNDALQELYNPLEEGMDELCVRYSNAHIAHIRPGDKVMYTANNYKAFLYRNQWDLEQNLYLIVQGNLREHFPMAVDVELIFQNWLPKEPKLPIRLKKQAVL